MNKHANEQMNSKLDQQTELVHRTSPRQKTQTSQKERKHRKMTETILPQILDHNEKSKHRESSRLRSQPRKNYKTFVP